MTEQEKIEEMTKDFNDAIKDMKKRLEASIMI